MYIIDLGGYFYLVIMIKQVIQLPCKVVIFWGKKNNNKHFPVFINAHAIFQQMKKSLTESRLCICINKNRSKVFVLLCVWVLFYKKCNSTIAVLLIKINKLTNN